MRFFVSYSRSIKPQVKEVVELLRATRHDVWWDGDIPTIADWWANILENIEKCEVMIFMISEKSAISPYCLDELRHAINRNRPILPFIMDDHSKYTIPSELGRRQWFVHDGDPARMLKQIIDDCDKIDWQRYQDRPSRRPAEPNSGAGTLTKQFQQAVSLAEAGQFGESIKRFNNVASLDYAEWGQECQRWIVRVERYSEISDLSDHKATLGKARIKWDALIKDDPDFANEEFDPLLVRPKLVSVVTLTIITSTPPTKPKLDNSATAVRAIIGEPFEWCDAPAGDFLYGDDKKTLTLPKFSIAKYPITYAQFQTFIDAKDGFFDPRWWEGLAASADHYEAPGEQQWKIANHPRETVSWYHSMAFCRWLSARLGGGYGVKEIDKWALRLPTEFEREKAARGTKGLEYPWGNMFYKDKCNSGHSNFKKTTPVTQYPQGVSPYGVLDMCGNVYEWCLTDYENPQQDVSKENISSNESRVLRGGSWFNPYTTDLRGANRYGDSPYYTINSLGFRCSRFD